MTDLCQQASFDLTAVRSTKPLIHNITNYVVMNYTANALLAMGASPVMAHAENEVADMASFAGALVLNIGTLTDEWVSSMIVAGQVATERNIPVILDPVGAGATPLRTRAAKQIISETGVTIIRGNASEILSLGDSDSLTKGVDALHSVDEAAKAATVLARELKTTLAITGPIDLVTDGKTILRISNGHELMPTVTGTGCSATAIIGAFSAVNPDPLTAASGALSFLGLAGERAAESTSGPGSFAVALIDALYTISPEDVRAGARIEKD